MWPAFAVTLTLFGSSGAMPQSAPLQWENDWAAARARAAREGRATIAVDVWATWCHTCLSMKHYVLSDPQFAEVADRHAWLALDFDLESNGPFFERHPIDAFPTFLVLDAKTEEVIARWVGSGSVDQMLSFFRNARRGDDALARGQRALASQDYTKARALLERALEEPTHDRTMRTRLLLAWLESLYRTDKEACAFEGRKRLQDLDDSSRGADFASLVAYCADGLPTEDQRTIYEDVVRYAAPLAANPQSEISTDDRSSAWGIVEMAYEALQQPERANAATRLRVALLEAAAKDAAPATRATFDYHRMQAYLRLGRHRDAIDMLEASRAAQPRDFNHPWRLAKVLLAQKEYARATAAIDDALAKGYGGRKLRLYSTKIDIQLAAGDHKGAAATVTEGRAALGRLNPAQVRPFWRREFEGRTERVAKETP